MRIGLFIPCYIDAFFPEVGIATLELLERFGHEVVYPRDQTCCGQPMANSGFNADCADTEALFVRNFSGFDYVVAPSGSCVHHVRAHALAPFRIWAMWMNLIGTPMRSAQPCWCIRHDESADTMYSAPARA
jgi:Fe-S oxidoreductase